jgi:protein-S-isoprenylcysteine O-methyltransferase Ste14
VTTSGRRAFDVIRSVLYAAGFVALWVWIGDWVRTFDAGLPFAPPAWLRPIGVVIAIAGALVAAACIGTFATVGRGTPAPFDPPREFVATGPYRYVRNPMYLGAAAAILGTGLAVSSSSVVLLAGGFLLVLHAFVVFHEEPALERRFGEGYRQYLASVHRWRVSKPKQQGPHSFAGGART